MNWEQPKVYAVRHKNNETRAASRSGGIFTAVSDWVLSNSGVVYGCVLAEDFSAAHIRADCAGERNKMRGSKYIQSELGDTFGRVKADLLEGRTVLFTGTSCQIAGLKGFLGKDCGTSKLICLDIVCHGVPSVKVWKAYLEWQEARCGALVNNADFRNKTDFGWHEHIETLIFNNGKRINSTIFKELFYGHMILRPSCHVCPYKSIIHPGDITIGDYWGIEKAAPELDDDRGVSLVLINNSVGECIFNAARDEVEWKATNIEDSMQIPLCEPFPRPVGRELFWHDFLHKGFGYIARKYGGNGAIAKLRRKLGKIKKKLVKK